MSSLSAAFRAAAAKKGTSIAPNVAPKVSTEGVQPNLARERRRSLATLPITPNTSVAQTEESTEINQSVNATQDYTLSQEPLDSSQMSTDANEESHSNQQQQQQQQLSPLPQQQQQEQQQLQQHQEQPQPSQQPQQQQERQEQQPQHHQEKSQEQQQHQEQQQQSALEKETEANASEQTTTTTTTTTTTASTTTATAAAPTTPSDTKGKKRKKRFDSASKQSKRHSQEEKEASSSESEYNSDKNSDDSDSAPVSDSSEEERASKTPTRKARVVRTKKTTQKQTPKPKAKKATTKRRKVASEDSDAADAATAVTTPKATDIEGPVSSRRVTRQTSQKAKIAAAAAAASAAAAAAAKDVVTPENDDDEEEDEFAREERRIAEEQARLEAERTRESQRQQKQASAGRGKQPETKQRSTLSDYIRDSTSGVPTSEFAKRLEEQRLKREEAKRKRSEAKQQSKKDGSANQLLTANSSIEKFHEPITPEPFASSTPAITATAPKLATNKPIRQSREDEFGDIQVSSEGGSAAAGPQLLIVNGQIVINQNSLIQDEESSEHLTADYERIEEEGPLIGSKSKITSATYNKREKTSKWDKEDTELFYRALRMFGTNFDIISRFFPHRSRTQVRNKYKKEEKENLTKIDWAMRNKLPIDLELFKKKNAETERIRNEKKAKEDAAKRALQREIEEATGGELIDYDAMIAQTEGSTEQAPRVLGEEKEYAFAEDAAAADEWELVTDDNKPSTSLHAGMPTNRNASSGSMQVVDEGDYEDTVMKRSAADHNSSAISDDVADYDEADSYNIVDQLRRRKFEVDESGGYDDYQDYDDF